MITDILWLLAGSSGLFLVTGQLMLQRELPDIGRKL